MRLVIMLPTVGKFTQSSNQTPPPKPWLPVPHILLLTNLLDDGHESEASFLITEAASKPIVLESGETHHLINNLDSFHPTAKSNIKIHPQRHVIGPFTHQIPSFYSLCLQKGNLNHQDCRNILPLSSCYQSSPEVPNCNACLVHPNPKYQAIMIPKSELSKFSICKECKLKSLPFSGKFKAFNWLRALSPFYLSLTNSANDFFYRILKLEDRKIVCVRNIKCKEFNFPGLKEGKTKADDLLRADFFDTVKTDPYPIIYHEACKDPYTKWTLTKMTLKTTALYPRQSTTLKSAHPIFRQTFCICFFFAPICVSSSGFLFFLLGKQCRASALLIVELMLLSKQIVWRVANKFGVSRQRSSGYEGEQETRERQWQEKKKFNRS
ncbi:hypothetical protein VP01_3243g2 [Puccinia sorghi]|uniref:Uncharacterized protein n=1 Tax=Puccinia sorghi TaxID=27349 RepID=A0A0L6UYX3_9BASI|nr:hypothetical protein VP01_3243g2 [Puccinia sorghi]